MDLTEGLCYILGAMRDGCLTSQNTIKIKQKNKDWLENTVIPKINNTFDLNIKSDQIYTQVDKTTRYYLAFKQKEVFNSLKDFLKARNGSVPNAYSLMSYKQKISFIRGFWDADGGCPRKPSHNKKLYLTFTQKDPIVLKEISKFLNDIGIKCSKVKISEKKTSGNIHRITIVKKKSITDFINKIGSEHPDKKRRLEIVKVLISNSERGTCG